MMQSTITLIIAVIGAALGVFNTWESYRDRRERVRVTPKWAMAGGFSGLSIEVTNTGAVPITIEEVGILIGPEKSLLPERVAIPNDRMVNGTTLPFRLDRGCSASYIFSLQGMPRVRYGKAYARTATGKLVKGDSPALEQFRNEIAQ